jgi:hypothetical protein
MLPIALMIFAEQLLVKRFQTAKSVLPNLLMLNASTQMTLLLAKPLHQLAQPISVQTQSIQLTLPVLHSMHWLNALQMPLIAHMLSVRLPPVPL